MFSFFSSEPPKVTEKMLIDAKIPLIHKEEISIEKKINLYNRQWKIL